MYASAFNELSQEIPDIKDISEIETGALTRNIGPLREKLNELGKQVAEQKIDPLVWHTEKEKLEIIASTFDSTGAYTDEIFHHNLFKSLNKRGLEFNETGLLIIEPQDEKDYWFAATLPDLPLVNQKGTHRAGDLTLGHMTRAFERGLIANGGWSNTMGVTHLRGADFNFNAYVESSPDAIYTVVKSQKLPFMDFVGESSEESPITISHVTVAEVIEIFNSAQLARGLSDVNSMNLNDKSVQKELAGILVRMLDYKRELDKVSYLGNKVIFGIQHNIDTEEYFNNFVKKYFDNSACPEYEDFKKLVHDNPNKARQLVKKQAEGIATNFITRGSADLPGTGQVINTLITQKFPQLAVDTLEGNASDQQMSLFSVDSDHNTELLIKLKSKVERSGGIKKLITGATIDEERNIASSSTYHARQLNRVRSIVQSASEEFENLEPHNVSAEHIELMRALLSISGLNKEIDTFGVKRNFYLEIDEILSKGYFSSQDIQRLQNFIQLHIQRQKAIEARHDRLTGLPNKFLFRNDVNQSVLKSLESGQNDTGVFFVDLAFLNYFNQKGNRSVGNEAITTAVRQLEEAFFKEFGEFWEEQVQIYRYGGDEITIIYKNGEKSLLKIKQILDYLNENGEQIKASGNVSPEYIPERVVYNYGFCDMSLAREGLAKLIESGFYNQEDIKRIQDPNEKHYYAKTLSTIMTGIADQLVDQHKISQRFKLLMQRYIHARESSAVEDRAHFNNLLTFSGKALLGAKESDFEEIYSHSRVLLDQGLEPDFLELFKNHMSGRVVQPELDVISTLIKNKEQESRAESILT